MYSISIKQPWASLVIAGIKDVENRTWATSYRGPLLIHASKKWDKDGAEFITERHPELKNLVQASRNLTGVLLGQVLMTNCVQKHRSEWFSGPYGFIFMHSREFYKPIPYKGQLGIFSVPDNILWV